MKLARTWIPVIKVSLLENVFQWFSLRRQKWKIWENNPPPPPKKNQLSHLLRHERIFQWPLTDLWAPEENKKHKFHTQSAHVQTQTALILNFLLPHGTFKALILNVKFFNNSLTNVQITCFIQNLMHEAATLCTLLTFSEGNNNQQSSLREQIKRIILPMS